MWGLLKFFRSLACWLGHWDLSDIRLFPTSLRSFKLNILDFFWHSACEAVANWIYHLTSNLELKGPTCVNAGANIYRCHTVPAWDNFILQTWKKKIRKESLPFQKIKKTQFCEQSSSFPCFFFIIWLLYEQSTANSVSSRPSRYSLWACGTGLPLMAPRVLPLCLIIIISAHVYVFIVQLVEFL